MAWGLYDHQMTTTKVDSVQDVRFARSADGLGIAYAIHGSGAPLLIDACWLSHLQFDWQSPCSAALPGRAGSYRDRDPL